jgi:hypothetical protein
MSPRLTPERGLIRLTDLDAAALGGGRVRTPRPPRGDIPWYADSVTVRKVDENSTATTVSNSNSETTIASLNLPALVLSSTGAARLSVTGTVDKAVSGTVTFRVKAADDSITTTVLATSGVDPSTSASPHPWGMEVLFLGKQPNVNRSWGFMDVGVAKPGGTLAPSTYSSVGFSTMGLDETDEWTISITAQMSAASTAFSVTRQVAILEALN